MKRLAITHPKISAYLQAHCERDAILRKMEAWARRRDFPIVGPVVGRFLAQMVMLAKPKRIVELGSGFGYSAYWMARAGSPRLCVECSDLSEENIRRAEYYLRGSPCWKKIRYAHRDGIDHLQTFRNHSVEMIVMDIDKQAYPDAFPVILRKLKKGGILIADNMLWSGRILSAQRDAATQGVRKFTRMILKSPHLYSHILPIRDGVSVSIRR